MADYKIQSKTFTATYYYIDRILSRVPKKSIKEPFNKGRKIQLHPPTRLSMDSVENGSTGVSQIGIFVHQFENHP